MERVRVGERGRVELVEYQYYDDHEHCALSYVFWRGGGVVIVQH